MISRLALENSDAVYNGHSGRSGSVTPTPFGEQDDLDYNFVDPLKNEYQCPVCCRVLKCPVMFDQCGHRCCATCLPEILRTSAKCPLDGISIDRNREVSVDKDFQAEIDKLSVFCSFSSKGCSWMGKLKDLQMHMEDCRFKVSPCPKGCGLRFEKAVLKKHLMEECSKRDILCDFCSVKMRAEDEVEHLKVCGKFLLTCPNNCRDGKEVARQDMEEHLENVCSRQKIKCPFWESGCQYMCKRKHMDKHIKDDPLLHLGMACDVILAQRKEMEVHKKKLDTQLTQISTLERKVDALEKLYGCQLVWRIDSWAERFHEAKLGRKATVFSPPFLTSRHGYKLALAICPYGDGKARGKYVSIFVCVCKGEYDPLLLWPFRHRIAFTLIDQCQDPDARRNVSYVLNPNAIKDNKPFLGRPVGDRNASFGAQKFLELTILDTFDYVRDDTIYIKCDVDSENMTLL